MEAQREQEERNRMIFRQVMEKHREAEAEESEKDWTNCLKERKNREEHFVLNHFFY